MTVHINGVDVTAKINAHNQQQQRDRDKAAREEAQRLKAQREADAAVEVNRRRANLPPSSAFALGKSGGRHRR